MADNNVSLSVLRKTYLSSTIATQEWISKNFTELSTTNLFIDTITDELSNNINPKLSTIADSVEEEVAKLDELSGKLSGYATTNDISAAIQTLDGNVVGTAGAGKTLTSFSQTDGKVTAGFADIAITKSQVTDFPDIPEVDGTFVHLSGDTLSDDFALKTSDGKNFLSSLAWRAANNSLAIGYNSQVSSNYSLAIGAASIAGNSATAVGQNAAAVDSSTAIGRLAKATGSNTTTLGTSTKATGNSATAIGYNAQALSASSMALGYNANSNGYDGIAIGANASTENGTNNDAIAIGTNAKAIGAHSIAMGRYAVAAAQNSIQLGVINNFPLSNNTANTFQVWDKPLLERTGGKIFFDRIPTGTTSATVAVGNHTHNTADLTNGAGFITSAQVDEKIDAARVKTMEYQGSVTTYANLPSSGNKQGDVWNVVSAYNDNPPGTNYAWNGTAWDPLGGSIDTSVFALKSEVPLSVSQLINDSGYITSSYVSLSAVEKSNTLVLTEEQKAALVQASGMPAEAFGDFAVSVRTSDGMGYIGPIDCFSAVENENGDWIFVGGLPSLNAIGWVANSTVIQGTAIHTILSVDNVSVDIATKDELAGYLPLNGGGVVTGNVAIQNLDGDSIFSLNNYGKVAIGVGASIHPNAQFGVAIGRNAYAANGGIAINGFRNTGVSANNSCIAIGDSVVSGGYDSIQLGYANNDSDALFRVWKYPMLDGNGDIPYGRLSASAGEIRNICPISSTTDASISLTKNTYVYRITDSNNTGTFPTLVAPTDITQTDDYYFTFEIEWKTAASLASYPAQYDWINYPEIQTDGQQHTYYIAGRWDSGGSGAAAFTLNCWRTK